MPAMTPSLEASSIPACLVEGITSVFYRFVLLYLMLRFFCNTYPQLRSKRE